MQFEGATKVEMDLLAVLRWNEGGGCSPEHTARSVAISNAIEELQRLRVSHEELLAALKGLYEDNVDYIRINSLGAENNHCLVQARSVIATAKAGVEIYDIQ